MADESRTDDSRGMRTNFRQAQIYVDEQGRRRVDRDGSHQEEKETQQPGMTRGEAQKMIDAAFAKLRLSGPGVSGSNYQWVVNQVC